jgi:hypothetical protein
VGSGVVVHSGSFTVPLIPQEEPRQQTPARLPSPLTSGEVIDALASSLRSLREPHLRIDTRLYVNGYDAARFPDLLPDPNMRPRTHAPPSLVRQMIELPTGSVRPYLCAEFTSWHGQLVVTTYVRIVVLPGVLYVEMAAYMLPPLKAPYFNVDQLRIHTADQRLAATLGLTARDWLPALITAPFHLAAAARSSLTASRQRRSHRRSIADRDYVDYGAVTSIREQASDSGQLNYFMRQDTDMYVTIVQQKVVDAITALLDARGYETEKIKQIQNNTNVNFVGANASVGAIGPHAQGIAAQKQGQGQSA